MKLKYIKLLFFVLSLTLLSFFFTEKVEAGEIPDVSGRVVTSLGAPVVGVWAKWTDSDGDAYYEQTDNSGSFTFSPVLMTYGKAGVMIDSNLDGTLDTWQGVLVGGPSDADCTNNKQCNRSHSCVTNPHSFSVVLPAGWNGSFSTVNDIKFNNGSKNFTIADMVYTPTVPYTPTPTPTTAPIDTPTPTLTPTPTPNPLDTPTPTPNPLDTPTPTPTQTPTPIPGPTDTPTPTPLPTYTIDGTVFFDSIQNGIWDNPGDTPLMSNVTITITGASYAQSVTDGSGHYTFPNLLAGNYTVRITIPNGYSAATPATVSVTVGPDATVNFGVVNGYIVSGRVFNDINKNQKLDVGETNVTNYTLSAPGVGAVNVYSDGTYDLQDINAGTYTVSLLFPLPAGYIMVYPKSSSFNFTVGPGCTVDTMTGASCSARGDINNLNFAISDSIPWMQTYDSDVRIDNGITESIPKNPTCPLYFSAQDANATTPGMVFSGDSFVDFGYGSVSSTNWLSGGTIYPEVFSPAAIVKTSYNYISNKTQQAGIAPVNLTTVAGCANLLNCTLPGNLQSGVYKANGNLVLNAINFPNNKNYVFLVNGTLTFKGNVQVPTSSTVIFTSSSDIIVDKSVGAAVNVCPVPAGQLQGFFSADRDFVIEGINDCVIGPDKMLNIDGAVIINAGHLGGQLINHSKGGRDLCAGDQTIPSFTVKPRLDFILNAPQFLMDQSAFSNEVAP